MKFLKQPLLFAVFIAFGLLLSCSRAPEPVKTPEVKTLVPTLEIKPTSTPGRKADETPTSAASITTEETSTPTPVAPPSAPQVLAKQALAFPGAEGFGKDTGGGRGGRVIYVTNLNDSGAGSFRDAITAAGPRIVEFQVAGTINLERDIDINTPSITIAGQTAPGDGVEIKGGMIRILTHDVIVRYLKIRMGDPPGGKNAFNTDPISMSAQNGRVVYNVIVDHCTLVWGTDIGGISVLTDVHDVTIQDSIIGEGLYYSTHPESPHSKAINIMRLDTTHQPTRITVYRNLITTSDERNPQVQGAINADVVDNVIFNWGRKASFGNPKSLNLINNTYIKGPESDDVPAWNLRTDPENPVPNMSAVYEQGNVVEGITVIRGGPSSIYTSTRFAPYSIKDEMSPQDAYNYVLKNVGANLPVRDSVDQRIIQNLINRTGNFLNSKDLVWPVLAPGVTPVDSDLDGMPDFWEMQYFGNLDRGSSTNSQSDYDGDGYTDVEEYLNGTNPTVVDP